MTYDNLYCVWLTTEMRAETCGKYRYVAEAAEAAACCAWTWPLLPKTPAPGLRDSA